MFVEELEGLVHMECRTVYGIRHGCGHADTPVTKLYCLNALCEDLRLHVAHWNSIKQKINTNRWLQPRLGQLCLQLQSIMQVCDCFKTSLSKPPQSLVTGVFVHRS